jgi:hypothetical protein
MKHTLTLHEVTRTHARALEKTVMRYEVTDERGQLVAFITNTRASAQPASWQISRVKHRIIGESTGDYATTENALSALQKEFDN